MDLCRLNQLVGLPVAKPDESPNSWFTRAALSQAIAVREFLRFLYGTQHVGGDQDLAFAKKVVASETTNSLASIPFVAELARSATLLNEAARAKLASDNYLLHRNGGRAYRKGIYRFCSICLNAATAPYFKQQWRFRCMQHCPIHDCLLEERCPGCGTEPFLPGSMVRARNSTKFKISSVKSCWDCGADLTTRAPVTLDQALGAGSPSWALDHLRHVQERMEMLARGEPQAHPPPWPTQRTTRRVEALGTVLRSSLADFSADSVRLRLQ